MKAAVLVAVLSAGLLPGSSNAIVPPGEPGGRAHVQVRTYPDPFADHFTVTMPEGLKGHVSAQLLDGAFRPVKEWPLGFAVPSGSRIHIAAGDIPAGTYTFRIWDEYGDAGATVVQCQ